MSASTTGTGSWLGRIREDLRGVILRAQDAAFEQNEQYVGTDSSCWV
jgi:hypothetical protein